MMKGEIDAEKRGKQSFKNKGPIKHGRTHVKLRGKNIYMKSGPNEMLDHKRRRI